MMKPEAMRVGSSDGFDGPKIDVKYCLQCELARIEIPA
jgi:hypothetical protein